MKISSRTFATLQNCTDQDSAHAQQRRITAVIDAMYERGEILGYECSVIATDDDFVEHDFEYMHAELVAVVGDRRPFVCVSATLPVPTPKVDPMAQAIVDFELVVAFTDQAD
jgi:hypothetical protein